MPSPKIFARWWRRSTFIQRSFCCILFFCTLMFWFKWQQTNLLLQPDIPNPLDNKPQGVIDSVQLLPSKDKKVESFSPHQTKSIPVESDEKTTPQTNRPLYHTYRRAVVQAMNHSWTAYRLYAWGSDEVHPLTKSSSVWMDSALTMIDGLDTLCIMGMKKEFNEAVQWIETPGNLEFNTNKDHVNVFETTIRILGGLLAAFHCEPHPVLLSKAKNLGDRLIVAFDSPSGLPYSDVNLYLRKAQTPQWTSESSLSEVTSLQLELNELSRLLKNSTYGDLGMRALNKVITLAGNRGLLPIMVDPLTGSFKSNRLISMGARGDSFYEYLIKVWVQTGKKLTRLKEQYLRAINEMKYKLLKRSNPNNLLFVGELIGGSFSPKMDHLVCFLPGTLIYGVIHGMPRDHLIIAKDLMQTCFQMYAQQKTGLAPEIAYFRWSDKGPVPTSQLDIQVQPLDAFNILRPETVESLFYLYRFTGDTIYRDWGWQIFQAFETYTKLPEAGYVGVEGVTDPRHLVKRTKCESFWYAETLKYFFLLFHDANENGKVLLPLDKWVFNTEAHAFPLVDDSAPVHPPVPVV